MSRTFARIARVVTVLAVAGGLAAGPSLSQTPTPCQADVRGRFLRDEVFDVWKNAVFGVEISSPAPCAKVSFDLITTERLFNGEQIKTTSPMFRKVTAGGTSSFKVSFKMAKDSDLVDSKVEFRRCDVCGN